ncbi:hypothetical protein V8E36_007960 [Tilletia maclaganii]
MTRHEFQASSQWDDRMSPELETEGKDASKQMCELLVNVNGQQTDWMEEKEAASDSPDCRPPGSTVHPQPGRRRTAAQVIEDKLAEAETRWTEMLEQQKEELSTLWSQIIDDKLKAHSEAVEIFSVEERVGTLEDGQPSRVDEDKVVIVVNAVQLDELREALRAHRSHAQATKKSSDAIDQLWDKMEELEERIASVTVTASTSGTRRAQYKPSPGKEKANSAKQSKAKS